MWPRLITRRYALFGTLSFAAFPAYGQEWTKLSPETEVQIPLGFAVDLSDGTLSFRQITLVRSPLTMQIRVDPNFALHRIWFASRHGSIRYTTANLGGEGSGGPMHELRALRILNGGIRLGLIAQRQAEGRPDFLAALDVLSSARRRD